MKINAEAHAARPVKATINLTALQHNLARVKELAPQCRVISVIKANAYGHGVLPVAKALYESDYFAVARLDEALYLRNHGINKTIILLEGVFSANEYYQCLEQGFIPVIHCPEQFQWLQDFSVHCITEKADGRQLEYWLKLDTGMHRLGLLEDDLLQIEEKIPHLNSNLKLSAVMSHFACADETENELNAAQLLQFNNFCSQPVFFEIDKSMANSAAVLSIPDAHFDWVRPGIMLYGVSPFEASRLSDHMPDTGLNHQLKPVMTLSSELIVIKKLKKGDCIGYGASWCCPEDMTIGVAAMGYGDGYPRQAPSGTPVLVNGVEVPTIGRVSMDMLTVDLSCFEQQTEQGTEQQPAMVKIGDKVIFWGENLPIEYVSQKAGTIAYELLCQITQRVYLDYE